MKILQLTPRITGVGGIAQHVRKLSLKLAARGFDVDVISSEYLRVPRIRRLANPSYSICSCLKALLDEYDIVHGHNLPSLPAVSCSGGKKILTLHGLYSRQVRLLHGRLTGHLASLVERAALRGLDALTAVSSSAARYYSGLGVNVEHIPNAVDFSDLPGEAEKITDPQIIYLGRLSYEKGVDVLLRAASEYGVRGLVVAGDGPLRRHFEEAHKRNLLTYLGPLPRRMALRLLAGSDAAVIPSREEGVSTFLLEAMALKVPVIASRAGGNIEVVRDGLDGILVHPDPRGVAEAIAKMLRGSGEVDRMRASAYERVREEFSWDVVIEKYLRLYRRVLGSRGK